MHKELKIHGRKEGREGNEERRKKNQQWYNLLECFTKLSKFLKLHTYYQLKFNALQRGCCVLASRGYYFHTNISTFLIWKDSSCQRWGWNAPPHGYPHNMLDRTGASRRCPKSLPIRSATCKANHATGDRRNQKPEPEGALRLGNARKRSDSRRCPLEFFIFPTQVLCNPGESL